MAVLTVISVRLEMRLAEMCPQDLLSFLPTVTYRSKQAALCTARSAQTSAQREERMLLNKMYSPLWESSDANWLASVSERQREWGAGIVCRLHCGKCALVCEQHRSYFVCLRVCEPVDKRVLLPSISLSPAAALNRGGEQPQKQLCFMAKAYRTIKTEAVCCTALCVAD